MYIHRSGRGADSPVHVKMAKRIPLAPVPGIIWGELDIAEDDGVVRALAGDWDEVSRGKAFIR